MKPVNRLEQISPPKPKSQEDTVVNLQSLQDTKIQMPAFPIDSAQIKPSEVEESQLLSPAQIRAIKTHCFGGDRSDLEQEIRWYKDKLQDFISALALGLKSPWKVTGKEIDDAYPPYIDRASKELKRREAISDETARTKAAIKFGLSTGALLETLSSFLGLSGLTQVLISLRSSIPEKYNNPKNKLSPTSEEIYPTAEKIYFEIARKGLGLPRGTSREMIQQHLDDRVQTQYRGQLEEVLHPAGDSGHAISIEKAYEQYMTDPLHNEGFNFEKLSAEETRTAFLRAIRVQAHVISRYTILQAAFPRDKSTPLN